MSAGPEIIAALSETNLDTARIASIRDSIGIYFQSRNFIYLEVARGEGERLFEVPRRLDETYPIDKDPGRDCTISEDYGDSRGFVDEPIKILRLWQQVQYAIHNPVKERLDGIFDKEQINIDRISLGAKAATNQHIKLNILLTN